MRYVFLIAIMILCACERREGIARDRTFGGTDDLGKTDDRDKTHDLDEPDDLFVARKVPKLRIEIPEEGMKVLRNYRQVWRQTRPERIDVKATVREGTKTYHDVGIHLKGSFTFQPIDARPSLTLH